MPPVVLLGEAWGESEARIQAPFVGAAGVELLKMLREAGLIDWTANDTVLLQRYWDTRHPLCLREIWQRHPEVYPTNVFNLRPDGNRIETLCTTKVWGIGGYPALTSSKYLQPKYLPELERLGHEIEEVDPNLVVCLGNTPLWALAGTTGISKLRGTTRLSTHCISGFKLLPTYHPAAVLREWSLRPITVIDLIKAKRESASPAVIRPEREIWIEPTIEDLHEFYDQHIRDCDRLAVDIETSGSLVTCIGFSPHPAIALVLPFFDGRRKDRSYWRSVEDERMAVEFAKRVMGDPSIRKTFQNGLYDIAFLARALGVATYGAEHDTMLLHHALQPESLKSLGFLGSIYSDEGAWKQDRKHGTIKRDE